MIWATIKSTLGRVPLKAWIAIALVLAWQADRHFHGNARFADGRESVKAELRQAEAKAVDRSMKAAANADEYGAKQAEQTAQVIAGQLTRIEEAEKRGESALDAYFNW